MSDLQAARSDNSTRLKEILISLIGNAPSGIMLLDLYGSCTLANHCVAEMLDRRVSDLVDKDIKTLFGQLPRLHEKISRALAEGRNDFDVPELQIGTRFYTVRSRGVLDGQIVVFDDVTDNVNHRKETERLVEELKNANQELCNFAYISSHDMKSPVASLYGLIEMLADEDAVKPEHQELLELVRRSVRGVRDTISTLNEVLKYRHSLEVDRTPVCLETVLDEVKDSISHTVDEKNAEFETDFSGCTTLPMAKVHLKSLLQNLISNSIKYSHPDRAPRVRVHSHASGNTTVLTIADNGLGIDLDKHGDRLFGLFNRFHSHTEGSGVGLYIVQSIVKCYSGHIAVRSKVDNGSEFIIEVPNA